MLCAYTGESKSYACLGMQAMHASKELEYFKWWDAELYTSYPSNGVLLCECGMEWIS